MGELKRVCLKEQNLMSNKTPRCGPFINYGDSEDDYRNNDGKIGRKYPDSPPRVERNIRIRLVSQTQQERGDEIPEQDKEQFDTDPAKIRQTTQKDCEPLVMTAKHQKDSNGSKSIQFSDSLHWSTRPESWFDELRFRSSMIGVRLTNLSKQDTESGAGERRNLAAWPVRIT